jgi:hypothetical protein
MSRDQSNPEEQNILPTWFTNGELFFKTTNIGINSTNLTKISFHLPSQKK